MGHVLSFPPYRGARLLPDMQPQRRLAAIVAIDVAGYSARAEADEAAAAEGVAALSRTIAAACEAHGGRVFNTAGDGFMLEFGAVSAALEAAETIAREADLPVRAGAHLGEVLVTPTGDLLGHGVNVAARIQALAPQRGVLVSADVKRALRGPLAGRLASRGQAKLDKMGETIGLFVLAPAAGAAPREKARAFFAVSRRLALSIAAVTAVLLLAGGAVLVMALARAQPPRPSTIAVAPFRAVGGEAAERAVADGLRDEINGALAGGEILLVSAAAPDKPTVTAPARADLVLSGSIERTGDQLQARVRLDDNRRHAMLWSETLSGPASDPKRLEVAAASKATAILFAALMADRMGGDSLDGPTLADFINAIAAQGFSYPDGVLRARALMQRVVARAPRFAAAHASLASIDWVASQHAGAGEADSLRAEALAEARKALDIDPAEGSAYVVLARLEPLQNWARRERLLRKAARADPGYFYAHDALGYQLAEAGRTQEAVVSIRRGVALNSLHPGSTYLFSVHLAAIGRYPEARRTADRLAARWPAAWTDSARLALVSLYGTADEAQALLRQSQAHPFPGEEPALNAWADFLRARTARSPALRARSVASLQAAAANGALRQVEAIQALAQLGAVDEAYRMTRARRTDEEYPLYAFFTPGGASLRADPRFWPLMAEYGLAGYWLKSGRWPDFCLEVGRAPACRASAEAAAKVR